MDSRFLNSFDARTAPVEVVNQVDDIVNDCFEYKPWDEAQKQKGQLVRDALGYAFKSILYNVPPSADRSAALRKLREARMDCNSAITYKGAY